MSIGDAVVGRVGFVDGDDVEILSVDTSGVQGLVFVGTDDDTIFYDPNGAFDGLSGNETATAPIALAELTSPT